MATEREPSPGLPEVLRLFPSFVCKWQLREDAHAPVDAALLALIDELRRESPALAAGVSWQSGHGLHRRGEIRPLLETIDSAAAQVLEFLHVADARLRVTGCWANVNAPGAAHRLHAHPNNFLSGVYYAQVQEGAGTINFHDPRRETAVIRPPVTELSAYNTDQVVLSVATGTLLLFPAWLAHSVDANRSDRARISISFNLMFASFAETMSEPLWGES